MNDRISWLRFPWLRFLGVAWRHRLDLLLPVDGAPLPLRILLYVTSKIPAPTQPAGERLTAALLELGPVYIKFGQLLSTRPDLLSHDIVTALSTLQDSVPPIEDFDVHQFMTRSLASPWQQHFASIESKPLAAASIAQIHAAELVSGERAVIKIVRPDVHERIRSDMAELITIARWIDARFPDAYRFHLPRIAAEHEAVLLNETDMYSEARNQITLRRNFADSNLLYVPRVFTQFTRHDVLVMERVQGIPINRISELQRHGVDLELLAHKGVETFFTQVFQHNFFHADMHPGNIFIDVTDPADPKYIALDCAIIGSLSKQDQYWLARKLVAFFNRDYALVADLFFDSGWIPPDTDREEFIRVIRAVCDPIFAKPLAEISFADFVVELFRAAGQFNMELQPQLALLQKTLLYVEGLGRQLYPQLDLWQTAQPFMERWVGEKLSPLTLLAEWFESGTQNWQTLLSLPGIVTQSQHSIRHMSAELSTQKRVIARIGTELEAVRKRRRVKRYAGVMLVALGIGLIWRSLDTLMATGDISLLAGMMSAFLGAALTVRA